MTIINNQFLRMKSLLGFYKTSKQTTVKWKVKYDINQKSNKFSSAKGFLLTYIKKIKYHASSKIKQKHNNLDKLLSEISQ